MSITMALEPLAGGARRQSRSRLSPRSPGQWMQGMLIIVIIIMMIIIRRMIMMMICTPFGLPSALGGARDSGPRTHVLVQGVAADGDRALLGARPSAGR